MRKSQNCKLRPDENLRHVPKSCLNLILEVPLATNLFLGPKAARLHFFIDLPRNLWGPIREEMGRCIGGGGWPEPGGRSRRRPPAMNKVRHERPHRTRTCFR